MPFRKCNNGFTLIELLVVIAIISVLAAMLLPALRNAKEGAYSARCISNLRQLAVAVLAYTNDYEGYIPPVEVDASAGTHQYWDDILLDRGMVSAEVLRCPKANHNVGIDYVTAIYPNGYTCNSAFRQAPPAPGRANSNYVANGGWQGGGNIDVLIYGTMGTSIHHPFRYVSANPTINGYRAFSQPCRISEVTDSAGSIMFQDGGWQTGPDFIACRHSPRVAPSSRWADAGEKFNVVWFDGHTSSLQRGTNSFSPWIGLSYKMWTIDH